MKERSQLFLWVVLGLAATVGVLWQWYPLSDASHRMDNVRIDGFGFDGRKVDVSDVERKVFGDANLLKVYYQIPSYALFMTVLDGTRNRSVVHDPSYCFQGGGWLVSNRRRVAMDRGEGEIITLAKGADSKEVFVCFSNGRERYASVFYYWFDTMMRRLTLGRWGDEPVRIIIQPLNTTHPDWERLLLGLIPLQAL
jgi:hypothetical protein